MRWIVQCDTHPCNLHTLPFYCHHTVSNESSLNIKMFALHNMWRQGKFRQYMCTNLATHHTEYQGRCLPTHKKHHNNNLGTFSENCTIRYPCNLHLSFYVNNCCKIFCHNKISEIYKFIPIPILGFLLDILHHHFRNVIVSKGIFLILHKLKRVVTFCTNMFVTGNGINFSELVGQFLLLIEMSTWNYSSQGIPFTSKVNCPLTLRC